MFSPETLARAERVIALARTSGLKISTVESCTGGLIAACITSVSGASDVFERGFVTYANDAKIALVGVPAKLLVPGSVGAVSEEVARAMAEGALAAGPVDAAVSVTGIAGPGGATPGKPVGLVHIGAARKGRDTLHRRNVFPGDRMAVRLASVDTALDLLIEILS